MYIKLANDKKFNKPVIKIQRVVSNAKYFAFDLLFILLNLI